MELTLIRTDVASIAHNLADYGRKAEGAFSANTVRALRADMASFSAWVADRGLAPLPATPATVAAYVDHLADLGRKPATIRRAVASIAHAHRAAGLVNPCSRDTAQDVPLAVRRLHRTAGRAQRQAPALNRPHVERLLDAAGTGLRAVRDRALLAVAYDTLCRRSEIVAFQVSDLCVEADGSGTILVRRSKTDQEGEGSVRFLAPDTVRLLAEWLAGAEIADGPLFRSVRKGGRAVGEGLDGGTVARVFASLASSAGLDRRPSGHSCRVGAAQDQLAAGLDLADIMQAGGWQSPTMVARYTRNQAARRSASAKLAILQNRA